MTSPKISSERAGLPGRFDRAGGRNPSYRTLSATMRDEADLGAFWRAGASTDGVIAGLPDAARASLPDDADTIA